MIGSWARETTATTGTGSITTSGAVADRATLASMLSNGEIFQYVIDDNGDREAGIGTFTTAGSIVGRTEVRETLIAGSYNNTNPTPINLSGSAEIYIGETPSTNFNPMLKFVSLDATNKEIPCPYQTRSGMATRSWVTNRSWMIEYPAFGRMELSGLGIEITGLATVGTIIKLGIYKQGALNNTWQLMAQTATISSNVTIGKKVGTFASTLKLDPGIYMICGGSDGDVSVSTVTSFEPLFTPQKDYKTISRGFFKTGGLSGGNLLQTVPIDNSNTDASIPMMWGVGV